MVGLLLLREFIHRPIYLLSRHSASVNIKQFLQSQLSQSQLPQAQLRQSLKVKWLQYYRENREWLVKLGVWVSYDGERRPSSSFILATLSVLEPRLSQLMPIVVDLNSNPDRVVQALGLNFSPDDELKRAIASGLLSSETIAFDEKSLKLLPASTTQETQMPQATVQDSVDLYLEQTVEDSLDKEHWQNLSEALPHEIAAQQDAQCSGIGKCDPFQSIRNIDIHV